MITLLGRNVKTHQGTGQWGYFEEVVGGCLKKLSKPTFSIVK